MSEIGISNYDLNDIYNIKNPLEDDRIIEQIIKMKSKDGILHYGDIQRVNSQGSPKDGVYALDYFYAYMFNVWKDNFLSLDSKELHPKLQKLQKVLQKFQNVKSTEDVDAEIAKAFRLKDDEMIVESINEGNIDKDLVDAISKMRWNNSKTQSGGLFQEWQFVSSNMVTLGTREKMGEIKHRLYLNPKSDEIYFDVFNFVRCCEEAKLPYYFKFNNMSYGRRSDGIVIYSDSKNLENYLKILTSMKETGIDVRKITFFEPPMLTGVIDGWIGYGQEPENHENSYSSTRKDLLDDATNRVAINYVKKHMNDVIEYEGKRGTLKGYLLKAASENFSPKDGISNHLDRILQEALNNKPSDEYKDVSKVVKEKINQIIPQIAVIDSNYINAVREQIKSISKEYDVDENNMCFNVGEREKVKPNQYGYDKNKNAQTLIDSLLPDIRENSLELPDGSEISVKDYIRNIYAPYIPKSGIVTLKNGRRISVTQFFEDGIYIEGQEVYHGDIEKYLENVTLQESDLQYYEEYNEMDEEYDEYDEFDEETLEALRNIEDILGEDEEYDEFDEETLEALRNIEDILGEDEEYEADEEYDEFDEETLEALRNIEDILDAIEDVKASDVENAKKSIKNNLESSIHQDYTK